MADVISLLSLNIGNPSVERAQKQCEWLLNRPEDIFVLTETKASKGCSYIADFFEQYKYTLFAIDTNNQYEVFFPIPYEKELGVMIISKLPLEEKKSYFIDDKLYFSRQAETVIMLGDEPISIVGMYVPSRDRSARKVERKKKYLNGIKSFLKNTNNKNRIILGDLNLLERNHIPHYSTFFDWEYDFYDEVVERGFVDTYKYCYPNEQEYSWVGRTNDGYRYDYCFVSDNLAKNVLSCEYIHETRKIRITDHSAISLKMRIG